MPTWGGAPAGRGASGGVTPLTRGAARAPPSRAGPPPGPALEQGAFRGDDPVDAGADAAAAVADAPAAGPDQDAVDRGHLRGVQAQVAGGGPAQDEDVTVQGAEAFDGGPVGNHQGGLRGVEGF